MSQHYNVTISCLQQHGTATGMGASGGQVLKWSGSAWAPAADNAGMSQTDADTRYVNAAGDEMSGALTVPQLNVAGNWVVGASGAPQAIRVASNAAGSISSNKWTGSINIAHNLNITGNYIVLITPSSPVSSFYHVSNTAPNNFTLSSAMGFSFNYLVITRP